MSLDLGNLLGNLGSQYISARWGGGGQQGGGSPPFMPQGPRGGVLNTTPVDWPSLTTIPGQLYDYYTSNQGSTLPAPAAPNGGVTIQGNCPPPSYCVDGKTGKVSIKQKRRRRRRLATSSDIRDLSSLKSVLSPADLKMWIATHPS